MKRIFSCLFIHLFLSVDYSLLLYKKYLDHFLLQKINLLNINNSQKQQQ